MLSYQVAQVEGSAMLWWFIAGFLIPACLTVFYLILRRWSRKLAGPLKVEKAREQFRYQREWLEARYLGVLEKNDPVERLRWDDASWHDEVIWARDRKNGRLLALVGVHFEPDTFDFLAENSTARHATLIFQHVEGVWNPDGVLLDEIYPHEAFLRIHRLEPLVAPPSQTNPHPPK